MSPDTLVGTAGSLLGASGDSAANQLQADLQANGVELPTDIGVAPSRPPRLSSVRIPPRECHLCTRPPDLPRTPSPFPTPHPPTLEAESLG